MPATCRPTRSDPARRAAGPLPRAAAAWHVHVRRLRVLPKSLPAISASTCPLAAADPPLATPTVGGSRTLCSFEHAHRVTGTFGSSVICLH